MNLETNDTRTSRRLDAKWICGILFFVFILKTMFFYNLYIFTSPKIAVDTTTILLAKMYSGGDIDRKEDFEVLKKQFKETGTLNNPLLERLNIKYEDVENKSPREARLFIFKKITEPIYNEGPEGFAKTAKTLEEKETIKKDLSLLGLINYKNHIIIRNIFFALTALTILFLTLFIKFSFRLGRLINPAVILLASSFPGLVITSLLTLKGEVKLPIPQGGEQGYGAIFGSIINEFKPTISQYIFKAYLYIFLLGFALLIIALILCFFRKNNKNKKPVDKKLLSY